MAEKLYKIKFTQTRVTKEAVPHTFEEGKVYEVNAASRDRWIRRGCAVDVTEEATAVPTKKAEGDKK